VKPFGIMELVSRCKALLRRAHRQAAVLTFETIELDDDRHRVTVDGRETELTFKEYGLLKYLLENSGAPVSRDRLMEAVWGFAFTGETRTVDMHIKTLRKKLGEAGSLIETVRNVGYRIGR
jgi:two-component system alkaline phosphatase synthesis response regulator PhoP